MKLNTLKDLYIEQLKDVYSAETQIAEALPKMVEAASHADLKQAFQDHLQQTKQQISRLEQVFQDLGTNPTGHKCKGMEGLLKEAEDMLKENADSDVLDAALITNAQRVEHYEIAAYGTICTYAEMLGRKNDKSTLGQTLDEEKMTDENLTRLAEQVVNAEAMA